MGKVKCQLCGREFEIINTAHLRKIHGMTRDEYHEKFPDAPLISPEHKAIISEKGREARIRYNKSERGRENARNFCRKLNQDSERQRKKNQNMWTPERRELQRKVIHELHQKLFVTGELPESRRKQMHGIRGRRGPYRTEDGRVLHLDSYLEGRTVKFFELNHLEFEHETLHIPYSLNGKQRIYIPDFYLPKYNLIVETKTKYRLSVDINQAKREAAINLGYNYKFCTEDELEHWQDFLKEITALEVGKPAFENSVDAGKS